MSLPCVVESEDGQQEEPLTEMTMYGVVQQSDCLVLVNPSAAAVNATVAQEIAGWLAPRTG